MISTEDKSDILKGFPNIELFYETIIHKKVYNTDVIMAIPEGKKYFAWFTTFKNQNVCCILEISENKRIYNLEIVKTCFNDKLSYGTILYGTIFIYGKIKFFNTEDIYYYKGKDVSKKQYLEKLEIFGTIFSSEIKQVSYSQNSIVFGLPAIIANNFTQDVQNAIELLPYSIKYIQYRYKNEEPKNILYSILSNPNKSFNTNKSFNKSIIFKIKADIQTDIYNLYTDNPEIYDVACIPNYKTSVLMNNLFRNIKENSNLDAIEESDDEFENDKLDKFVYLDKEYNMVCTFNSKFKKWTPICLAQKSEKIITKAELFSLEKNKY